MTDAEAITARVAEILAGWPETTDAQREAAVRILARRQKASRVPPQRRAA